MNEAVNFISTKFDEYEKERKEREQVIKNFEENVSVMIKKVENLEKEIDKHEQYSRRNYLLVHGIVETDDEVTDNFVIETISTRMNMDISPVGIAIRYDGNIVIIETMSNATNYNFILNNVKGIQAYKVRLILCFHHTGSLSLSSNVHIR